MKNNLSYVKNISLIDINPNKIANLIKSHVANDYQKHGRENISHLGFNLDEMLLSCRFNNIQCNISNDFIWHYSYDFVNCYSFNSGRDNYGNLIPLKYVSEDGPNKSLQLEIFIGLDEVQSEFILSSGLYVVIHDHNVEQIKAGKGSKIPPGQETSFGLSMLNLTRLDLPYRKCIKNLKLQSSYNSNFFKAIFNILNHTIYSQKICSELCLQDYIKNNCGCLDPALPNIYIYNNVTFCTTLNLLDCVDAVKIDYFYNSLSNKCDQCPNECDSVNYKVVYSSESRFSSYYKNYISNLNVSKYFSSNSRINNNTDLSKSVIKLNIFYNELKVTLLNQAPLLTPENLVSNIGGIVSLFLGMTLLEIPKIIEFFINNLIFLIECNRPKRVGFI